MSLPEDLARYSQLLWERGWVANHDGNLSVRDGPRFLATPTAESKRLVEADWILGLELDGTVVEGSRRVFGEWNLHAAAYRVRPDVGAVIHAHPVHATAAGLTGLDLTRLPLPEAIVSLGAVPTAKPALPGAQAARAVEALIDAHDVLLLPGNGLLAVGDDLEQAYLRAELAEHLAHIVGVARAQGRVRTLDAAAVSGLLAKRKQAGLGPEGRAAKGGTAVAPGADVARVALAQASSVTGDARLAQSVADEVVRTLGGKP